MLKKSANVVLTSLRGSYGLGKHLFRQAMGGVGKNSLRFASSLAAALPDGLFEHPATDPIC